ncbi:MAG: hypothetical protein EBX41_02460 [Chitinophagia bacterium]|nr:hypothetical protein [Chitinophagia bacterium]
MALQDNLVENILDTQKKVMDSVVENTKKFTAGNAMINETLEKGNDWYKNMLDTQKQMFDKTGAQAEQAMATAKDNTAKVNEFYQNWHATQMNWAKQIFELGQESVKNMANANQNPFANWQAQFNNNAQNPFQAWMSNMTNTNWANNAFNLPWMNPSNTQQFFNPDTYKKANDNITQAFTAYYQNLTNAYGEWMKNLQSGNTQDMYKNMLNSGEAFTKFAEIWMPMLKAVQNNTFNTDLYKQMMNPELYKDFMDKFFGFLPENARQQMTSFTNLMNDSIKNYGSQSLAAYQQMRAIMGNNLNSNQWFNNANQAYSYWNNMMTDAYAPFTKMITQNNQTRSMQEWSEIANRIAEYNIKNAELQYMVYIQGVTVMDKLAENVASKIANGVEVNSMLGLYQEWLNISDKVFVTLFESSEYSKLMAEVGAMKMRLQKDIELQTEKMFADIPVATRSEMDETNKTIYELKKRVRTLEKMLENTTGASAETIAAEDANASNDMSTEEKAAAKRGTRKA